MKALVILERWLPKLLLLGVPLYLLLFAIHFADERLYADSGYYLFHVVNEGGFHIEHGRWVLALSQALPWAGVKLGLPLGTVIQLHSLANVAFLVLAMAYSLIVLRDQRTAVIIAAAQVIGLAHGLFCPIFELYYGVGLVLLFHATATNDRLNGWNQLLLCGLLFLGALSSHPMAWPLLLGSILLLEPRQRRPLLITLLGLTIAFALVRGLTMSVYESAQLSFLQRLAFPSLVVRLFAPSTLLTHGQRVLQHYPDVLLLALFSVAALWSSDRRRVALIFLVGLLGFYVATGLYLPDPMHDRYREQVDFAFAAWTLLIILGSVWSLSRWRPALLIALLVYVGCRMVHVHSIAPYYQARTRWHLDLIAQAHAHGLRKAIIPSPTLAFGTADERVAPYWSTGLETLLLSAKDGAEQTVSVITADDADCASAAEDMDKLVLRCGDVVAPEALAPRYFHSNRDRYEPLAP